MKKLFYSIIKTLKLNPSDHGIYSLFGKKVAIGCYERDFYVFSNFSSFQINHEGKIYPTSEHLYHCFKFTDEMIKEKIRLAPSAHEAFYVALGFRDQRISDWNDKKADVMKKILRLKVDQHPYVKKKLIDSGDLYIVEDSWRDNEWGWGEHRDGKNLLGNCWMAVREEVLKNENK